MIDDKSVNQYIQEELDAIDKETKDDEEIRSRGRQLMEALKKNKSVKVQGYNNEYWQLTHHVYSFIDKTTKQERSVVRLICANEIRMKIGGLAYQPLTIDAEIDDDFNYEQALEAATTAFVAKQFGMWSSLVEELPD